MLGRSKRPMYNGSMDAVGSLQAIAGNLPLDWLVLGAVVIVIALDALRSGLGRAISIALALPIAHFFFLLADSTFLASAEGLFSTPFMHTAVFGVLFVGLYFLIRRMGLEYVDSGMGAPVQAILGGTGVAVVFACIWLQTPVLSDLRAVSEQVETIFNESVRLWWLLGAYIALAFARG